jgi:sugar phosphate isomerase/epimerase
MKRFLVALLSTAALMAAPPAGPPTLGDRLGLQLWSLRKDIAADIPKGLAEVKALGIVYVEPHSSYGATYAEFRRRLDEAGLKATAAHFPYEQFDQNLDGLISDAKTLGVQYVIVPWLPKDTFDAETAKDLAVKLNTWGAKLSAAGLKLGYHPHGFEFVPVEGGGTAFDLLMRSTNPKDVCFELDVFWAAHAGADPVALLKTYPDRWKLLHVKDMAKNAVITPGKRNAPEAENVAVGQGQIDWKPLLKEAGKIGIEYYFLEDETSTPQKSLPVSVKFLKDFKP